MIGSNGVMQNEVSEELAFPDIFEILRRRQRVIIATLFLSLAIGIFLSTRSRRYIGEGVIRVQPGTASMYRTSPLALLSGDSSDKIASEVTILQSRTLYLQVAKDLNLASNPDFWDKRSLKFQSLDDPKIREKTFRLMREKIHVTHQPKDEIITVTCTTISPALSAKIVNSLVNDYVEYLYKMRYGASQRASGWLIGQLDDLKQQIEHDQTTITDLQGKLGVVGFDEKDTDYLLAQSLNSMSKAAGDATIARIVAEAKYRFLQDSDPDLIEGEVNLLNAGSLPSSQNSLLQNLRNTRAQLAASYAKLSVQFGPNYIDVKQQKAQLDEINLQIKTEEARILHQAELSYSAASANEKMTDSALLQKKDQAFSSHSDMVKYVILLHDYQAHRTLYEGLVARLREAGITAGMEGGEIDIVDLADLPVIPAPPGPLLFMTGSLFAGLIAGCLLAFMWEAMDTRITTLEQAERATSLPLLATLPHIKRSKKSDSNVSQQIASISAPNSRYAEAVQSLRSSLLLARPGSPPQVILVTSSFPGEGKSTTSINLASILAQHHARVLLVDCDLRRGRLSKTLKIREDIGLSNILTRQATLDAAIQVSPLAEGLKVLGGGPHPPEPAILVGSTDMHQLIEDCKKKFDFILLDCPPTLGISDTLNLGRFAEAVILIVRTKVANRKAVQRSKRVLDTGRLPVLGFVMNDVDSNAQGYGSGDYYGYYQELGKDSQ